MPKQSNQFADYLTAASWDQLIALMAAHQLPRSAKQTKAELVEQLYQLLTNVDVLSSIIAQLDAVAKDALRYLLAADGALPVHTFEKRYGPIRPYRPWRKDEGASAPQPWLAPISVTETLWYLGLIYRDPPKRKPGIIQCYVLPSDLIVHLIHLLGQTEAMTHSSSIPHPGWHGSLDHHLAIWLATIHAPQNGKAIKPVHKRWLPPSTVALLCTRLGLDQEPAFTPIRSERHHPYLALLHYLALSADLVTVTPAAFQLTPAAWAWLIANGETRHAQLVAAWQLAPPDLARPFGFSWEPLSQQARAFVTERLATLMTDMPQPLTQLVEQWRLADAYALLPTPRPTDWQEDAPLLDPVVALLTGPLHWLGLVTLSAVYGQLPFVARAVPPIHVPPAPCTMPKQPVNTILAPLNVQPLHLVRLARFCDWHIVPTPTPTPHTFTLDPDRIGQLAAQDVPAAQILDALAAALGRAPSRRVGQRIRQWLQPGQQLRLRPLLVLEADSADRLAQLRRHKLVRNRLGEVIAPNRIALNPADADALAQTLRTLGYYVQPPASFTIDHSASPIDPATAETPFPSTSSGYGASAVAGAGLAPATQWFLVALYQGLGQHLPLPIDLPWDLRQDLRVHLTALQQASAESAAQTLLDRLQMALNGYLQTPLWRAEPTTDAEPVIRTALAQGDDIEIRYAGPSDGHVTTRTVTPYWIEERHGTRYLIGWCHLRQQERVFRLDRIEAISEVIG